MCPKLWGKTMQDRVLTLQELTEQERWARSPRCEDTALHTPPETVKGSGRLAAWQMKALCLQPMCLLSLLLFTSSDSDLFPGSGSDPVDPVAAETVRFFLLSVFKSHLWQPVSLMS